MGKEDKFGSGVVRCCPSLKTPASVAQEMQMGHCKCEKDGMTCPICHRGVSFSLLHCR